MNHFAIRHDSRDPLYRSPTGALPAGSAIVLRLRAMQAQSAWLRLWSDMHGERRLPMQNDGFGVFYCEVALPDTPCLLWYWFEVQTPAGRVYYGNREDTLGGEGQPYAGDPPSYQITVYDAAFETPQWFRDGVMYQIFPDRFCRADAPQAPGRRMLPWQGFDPKTDFESPLLDGEEIPDYFFGGNLRGITQKLDYLAGLGVTILYLNPIFRARSNHRYDTGDYHSIDPLLGTREDFISLCDQASRRGIRVVLDGVFSHTGADSVYFNRYGSYPDKGAYQGQDSPYYAWYQFKQWPHEYECWWGHPSLPHVNELEPSYVEFILGEGGVARRWLAEGASGWRLDVADELPIPFVDGLRKAVKAQNPDAVLIGEVWEDATHKVAYSQMRPYALGHQLDSVMNYPLRAALLDFFLFQSDARAVMRRLLSLQENYPPPMYHALMNFTGTHDVARLRTLLSGAKVDAAWLRADMQGRPYRDDGGLGMARAAAFVCTLFALPGVPSIYYGDEIGMEGLSDPYCRLPFEWQREGQGLSALVRRLGALRKQWRCLRAGGMGALDAGQDVLCFTRTIRGGTDALGMPAPDQSLVFLANRLADHAPVSFRIPGMVCPDGNELLYGLDVRISPEGLRLTLPPHGCALIRLQGEPTVQKNSIEIL